MRISGNFFICDDKDGLPNLYKSFLERNDLKGKVDIQLFSEAAPLDSLDYVVAIITDGDMPGLTGGEFAKAARAQGYKGLIFLITSDVAEYTRYERYVTELICKDSADVQGMMKTCAEFIEAVLV